MSVKKYDALSTSKEAGIAILTTKFDAFIESMQTRASRRGMKAAFDASPTALGKAAVTAARKKRR